MGEEKDPEKKKKKSKSKDAKDPEDPDKKKKKKKSKDKEEVDEKPKDAKKDKKDKKKKKNKDKSDDGDESPAVISEDEEPKKSKKKEKTSKPDSFKKPKGPKIELFEAAPGKVPTDGAKKYGDVTAPALQKKCKKLYKLLNFDPWNNARRFDDDDLCDYAMDNPEPCTIKFEFDGFSGCIYPLSMCYALNASRDTVEAVYDAFPPAVKETDWWIGTPYHYAGAYGANAEVVRFLVQKDPKGVEVINYYGRTALHMGALFSAPTASMEVLCSKYPEACQIMDKDGYIPLHLACENGAESAVVLMLVNTYPPSVYATAQYGMTPLHYAASQNARLSVIRVLLDSTGGDNTICKTTDLLGNTSLHMALMGLAPLDVIQALVVFCPETVWMKSQKGELPLQIAERKRAPAETLQLLEKVMEQVLVGESS